MPLLISCKHERADSMSIDHRDDKLHFKIREAGTTTEMVMDSHRVRILRDQLSTWLGKYSAEEMVSEGSI